MPVSFQPSKYGVTVLSKYTSQSGKWIVFLGSHYDGKTQCWDVGYFNILNGQTMRHHWNKLGQDKDRQEAMLAFEEVKDKLSKLTHPGDDKDEYTIIKPN
jgi:hypothetical protein